MQSNLSDLQMTFIYSWCGPCRKLTPILEEMTANGDGKFKLVKLNIDNLPQIATGLKVRNIPAVFLINKGGIIGKNLIA